MIYLVNDAEDLNAHLTAAEDTLVVIDFFATWCGPCKMLAPLLEELAMEKKQVVFLKVDVDRSERLAAEYEINSLPTFVFIKNGAVLHSFSGSNIEKVKAGIEEYQ